MTSLTPRRLSYLKSLKVSVDDGVSSSGRSHLIHRIKCKRAVVEFHKHAEAQAFF